MREGAAAELLKQSHVDAAKDKADKGCSALSLDFKKLATETLQDYGLKLAPGAICNAAVGGFRHARQRGVVDAKDIDLEQGQVDDNHTKALPISLLDGLSAGRHYKEDLVGELVVEVVLTEIVKIDALPTEDMFPLTCSIIEQASTERSRTSSPNGRFFLVFVYGRVPDSHHSYCSYYFVVTRSCRQLPEPFVLHRGPRFIAGSEWVYSASTSRSQLPSTSSTAGCLGVSVC